MKKNLILIVLFSVAIMIFFLLTREVLMDMYIVYVTEKISYGTDFKFTINQFAAIITLTLVIISISIAALIGYLKHRRMD